MSGWRDPAQVDSYLGRIPTLQPRLDGEAALVAAIRSHTDDDSGQIRSILDLGCGDGRLMWRALEACPNAERLVLADRSEPMLERAREGFAGTAGIDIRSHDLDDSILDLGEFDLVISGFAIHHLDDARKRSLFAEISEVLGGSPTGLFANFDIVSSATAAEHAEFLAAIGRESDDPEDQLAPVEDQLEWMTEAGFNSVACPWRWKGFALMVGTLPR